MRALITQVFQVRVSVSFIFFNGQPVDVKSLLLPFSLMFLFFSLSLAGSQELLDSWLTLVSRLSNSETLMDSPHSLPQTSTATGFVPFQPINFLVATQKVHVCINYNK